MRTLLLTGVLGALTVAALGCGTQDSGDRDGTTTRGSLARPGGVVAAAGDVRFSLPTPHQVVVERRTAAGWGDARVVFEDRDRECGTVHATASGSTVAATVGCDESFAHDQVPTRSVALISTDARSWTHRDLAGEASAAPGLSPDGDHAVWEQGDDLLTWRDGSFDTVPRPTTDHQRITIDDSGRIVGIGMTLSAGRCAVEIRPDVAGTQAVVVPVADRTDLPCDEVSLTMSSATQIAGVVAGMPGTDFWVSGTGEGAWTLTDGVPVSAPGLAVHSDDPARAVWNQVVENTRGDLVAVGSPDRRRVTAQRYDRARQRWTPPRDVHVSAGATCRRRVDDSGTVQGAAFELRLVCDGRPLLLRSLRGASWQVLQERIATPRRQ